ADMFVLERIGARNHYRLAGTHLCNIYGRELKNEPFSWPYDGVDERTVDNWTNNIGGDGHLVLMSSTGIDIEGRTVPMETLLMPLFLNGIQGKRTLGITTTIGEPRWDRSSPVTAARLESVRMLRPWEEAPAPSLGAADVPWDTSDHRVLQGEPGNLHAFPNQRRRNDRHIEEAPSISPQDTASTEPVAGEHRKVGAFTVIEGGRRD
ncbi:MAG: PAS domain-containing protein, partial [Pseudomonadota bacterium]